MFDRLEPRLPFKGGRITETDVLDLTEAAKFASVHAGAEITPADFLRAAGRGEITLRAIVHQTAKLERVGGGVYCNAGHPNENTAPKNSILNLPLSACSQLAATGRASWREVESFESIDGVLMRFVIAELTPDEPNFETTTDDCRVTGNAVNALADAYTEAPVQTPAPVVVGLDSGAWETQARERAANIIKRQREKDLYPSQIDIADEIAREFRTAGILGADGKPLTGATIKRHALNGISSAQGKQLSTRTGRGK